jgi:hypothetical protein
VPSSRRRLNRARRRPSRDRIATHPALFSPCGGPLHHPGDPPTRAKPPQPPRYSSGRASGYRFARNGAPRPDRAQRATARFLIGRQRVLQAEHRVGDQAMMRGPDPRTSALTPGMESSALRDHTTAPATYVRSVRGCGRRPRAASGLSHVGRYPRLSVMATTPTGRTRCSFVGSTTASPASTSAAHSA